MDEQEFTHLADAMLARIERCLDDSDADIDYEVRPGGVIEIAFDNGSKVIVNRHGAAREIWVAARSGGFHFRPQSDQWVGTRDGEDLLRVLSRCLSEQAGTAIELA
ncbi:MAG: iron donor protein CyaY [Proteobacteria bacterium]|nr:iron donor protein CyaY [Pseudomonadota bacterium]HQR05048.1 iron donor protein CyaY [Rhodocyclaceae bacterium]